MALLAHEAAEIYASFDQNKKLGAHHAARGFEQSMANQSRSNLHFLYETKIKPHEEAQDDPRRRFKTTDGRSR